MCYADHMPLIAYTVSAILPDEPTAREYLDWLLSGHVQAVVHAGASSGVAARIVDPSAPIRVEARYVFANMPAYAAYLLEHAPGLRAEGLARFPPSRGIRFERSVAWCFEPGESAGESTGLYSVRPDSPQTPSPSTDRGPHDR